MHNYISSITCTTCKIRTFVIIKTFLSFTVSSCVLLQSVLVNLYIHECILSKLIIAPDSVKSKTDNISKITNWVKMKNKQLHSKVLLNSFPTNGHTLEFCTWIQKLETFVSLKVSPWESEG